jgi:hypothetical protein
MTATVDFDHQFRFTTIEIDDPPCDRLLPTKSHAEETTIAQVVPELRFRLRRRTPEIPRVFP